MEDDALDKIAKEIMANEAGIKSFDQLINEFETDMLKGLSQADAADFANWYLDSGFDKEGKARAWLNENTDRLADPRMVDDDTSFAMEQQGFDEVAETNRQYDLENALTDDEIFMRDIQPDIDDYYADLAAREPSQSQLDKINKGLTVDEPFTDIDVNAQARQAEQNRIEQLYDDTMADRAAREPDIDKVNSYYESLSQADQDLIDAHYDNLITDSQVINVADNKVTGKVIKKTIKSRLKNLLIGGVDALDMYELGLIGMALVEPAVEKALQPLMPMIIPGYKGKVNSKTYGQQVMENLQTTAKISPTAKVSETIADIPQPQTQQLTGMGWVGKMLDR